MQVQIIDGRPLWQVALNALPDNAYVKEPGECQHFIRQCIETRYGAAFEAFRGATAEAAMHLWMGSAWAHAPGVGSAIGDVLYFVGGQHGPNGHVVVRCPGNCVIENSVVHSGPVMGSKGVRQLAMVGPPSLIVRLP